jgi:signal transduction histidine kinase
MEDTHLIREAQQIKLFADRIAKIIESDNNKTKPQDELNQEIENIDQLNNTARNFLEVFSSRKTITSEFLTKIHHELRTPLVPILAYTDMLLDSKYGSISDEQRKRLEIINSSTKELVQTIQDLFNKKTFDITSDKHEADKDHKINELKQEKKILDRVTTALSDDLGKTRRENVELKKDLTDSHHKIKESEQEKIFASKSAQDEQEKNFRLQKKHYITIAIIAILVSGGFAFYSYYENQVLVSTTSNLLGNYNSNYLIQNLQGDRSEEHTSELQSL